MSRVLSELRYQYGGKYRFTLLEDLTVDLRKGLSGYHILQNNGSTWAVLHNGRLTLCVGYAFDGCSPAWRLFGKWYGVYTPPKAVAATAVHDALRGFGKLPCLGYTRKDADDIFYDMLREEGFALGDVYHGAVAGFWGKLYDRVTNTGQSSASCQRHPQA